MPAFDTKPVTDTLPPIPTAPKPVIAPDAYKTSIVDDKREPYAPQMLYMEGSTLVVTWLSQVLSQDEEPRVFDRNQLAVYQKYTRIEKYELKLESGLSASFESQTSEMSYTSTAHCLPGVVPNYGDCFIAYIGENQVGLFSVIEPPTQKSPFRDTVYQISFQLIDYMSNELLDMINRRVVLEKVYLKDYLIYGRDPIVAPSDIDRFKQINEAIKFYCGQWVNAFYSHAQNTMVVPDQIGMTYDPLMLEGVRLGLETTEHPLLTKAIFYNMNEFNILNRPNVWQAIITANAMLLPACDSKCVLVGTQHFIRFPLLSSFRYSTFMQAVLPNANPNGIDLQYGVANVYLSQGRLTSKTPPYESPDGRSIPAIAGTDDYCFSQAFYNGDLSTPMTNLEYLIKGYVNTKTCDYKAVLAYLADSPKWNKLQQFYFIPALLFILKGLARRPA